MPWSRPQLSWSAPIQVGFTVPATSSTNSGMPGAGYCTANNWREPKKSWMVFGVAIAVTVVALTYQWAETARMARGRGTAPPNTPPNVPRSLGVTVRFQGVHRTPVPEERSGHRRCVASHPTPPGTRSRIGRCRRHRSSSTSSGAIIARQSGSDSNTPTPVRAAISAPRPVEVEPAVALAVGCERRPPGRAPTCQRGPLGVVTEERSLVGGDPIERRRRPRRRDCRPRRP